MIQINLKAIVGLLNETCRAALESAAELCATRTNYNLEIEHWLYRLAEIPDADLAAICKHCGIEVARLQRDLLKALDGFKMGNARPAPLSPELIELARDAWLLASTEFGADSVRSGHILCSLLLDDARFRLARELSAEFARIPRETLLQQVPQICAKTREARQQSARPEAAMAGAAPGAPPTGKAAALERFTIDLTEQARAGRTDPVQGRDAEIRQIIDILMRRRQNNPILTGEAGVGKTAVVEGFAQRVAYSDVPAPLKDVIVRSLDLGALQAGASVKGEFENRMRGVIDEIKASPQPVILFIDEAHTLVGAGGQAGQGDAANLLKPALARGELRTIAATTWAEYKRYFEKDAALSRRFQVVKVDEPNEAAAVGMIHTIVKPLERHHGVRILDEAVSACVRLSSRYISGRQLPDKAVSLMDTACARVAIARHSVPPPVEDLRRLIDQLALRLEILAREQATGADHLTEIQRLEKEQQQARADLQQLEQRWEQESALIERFLAIRLRLESSAAAPGSPATAAPVAERPAKEASPPTKPAGEPGPSDAEREQLRRDLQQVTAELKQSQGERPLLQPFIDKQIIAEVVSGWTGIPVGRMIADEVNTVLQLEHRLEERIVGQSHALQAIARVIRTSRADLGDPRKPIGVFFMPGPSGVGKTETALALAELLYGGEQNINVINMSEFKEEHKVSLLLGSPPGYVGYGEGGILTEAVRRRPYSVLLLDEMEKAHPGVQDIFYQVFDKGTLRDGEGRDIDFKNTVIIMTSNAASDAIAKLCADPETRPNPEALAKAIHPELLKGFKPAFLGRCTVVPYYPLTEEVMEQIVRLKLNQIVRRVKATYGAEMTYTPEMVSTIRARCTEVDTGARNIDHIVSHTLLPQLAAEFLTRMAAQQPTHHVALGIGPDGQFAYDFA